ncbi:MAG TPA: DUF5906 domain-containing protein [Streptosporangiaceae bacterium]|nr:DUF5906 domain-containing protein [Streptosporangiaceae bacterium]HVB44869.1 DUF5906 domain-containing protein [Streptosporangiaceae bacterium]
MTGPQAVTAAEWDRRVRQLVSEGVHTPEQAEQIVTLNHGPRPEVNGNGHVKGIAEQAAEAGLADDNTLVRTRDTGPQRGEPFEWEYLALWEHGELHLAATKAEMPVSDLAAVRLLEQMHEDGGWPIICGAQSGTWYRHDGAVYAAQPAGFAAGLAEWLAGMYELAMKRVRQRVSAAVARKHPDLALAAARDKTEAKDELAGKEAEEMEKWKAQAAYKTRLWSENGQAALIRQLGRTCGVDEEQLNTETGEIVLDNGRISYKAIIASRGRIDLLPNSPERLVTKRAGAGLAYDPSATCPAFERFLETSVADRAQREWLLWRTACALFGEMPRKGFVNLIGESDSGKSIFARLMQRLGGGYAITVPVQTFLAKHVSDSGFRADALRGARMVYSQEPEPMGRYDTGYMKDLTGRDPQRTGDKYVKASQWTPQCTPFIGSNNPIRFATSDEAFMGRQEVIRFARGYDQMDELLPERLNAELPGILALLVSCIARQAWYGMPPLPASMIAEREHLADETEDALQCVEEMIDLGSLAKAAADSVSVRQCVKVDYLYSAYRMWCESTEGIRQPLGRKTFSAIVGRRYPVKKSDGYRFTGLIFPQGSS